MLDRERSNLQNLETNLAKIATEELIEVRSRLSPLIDKITIDSVVAHENQLISSLMETASIVAPAIFAVNQFKTSKDFTVSEYLSKNITITSELFDLVQECTQLKAQSSEDDLVADNDYTLSISSTSPLGKLIGEFLPEQARDSEGDYYYEEVFESIILKAYRNLLKLDELLKLMQKNSRYQKVSNSNQQTMTDPFEKIAKLKKLRDDGILTESEFESKKKELLDRL